MSHDVDVSKMNSSKKMTGFLEVDQGKWSMPRKKICRERRYAEKEDMPRKKICTYRHHLFQLTVVKIERVIGGDIS